MTPAAEEGVVAGVHVRQVLSKFDGADQVVEDGECVGIQPGAVPLEVVVQEDGGITEWWRRTVSTTEDDGRVVDVWEKFDGDSYLLDTAGVPFVRPGCAPTLAIRHVRGIEPPPYPRS